MLKRHQTLPKGLAIASQSAEFWRRMAPELTISDGQPKCGPSDPGMTPDPALGNSNRLRLVNDGFVHLKRETPERTLPMIAAAMNRIVKAGLPAAFIGVYDEVWTLVAQMNGAIDGIFDGKGAMVPNFWACHGQVAPGLSAGRNRAGHGVFADGTPKTITVWMPLTEATPENGCVYVVPAGQDRNYGKSGAMQADASLPGIRALPAQAGDALIWTGETYRWQARPDRRGREKPLLSLTWEFQSRAIAPLEGLLIDSYPYVPFETRLALVARQMPRYRDELTTNPVWRVVQQTLANRFRMAPLAEHA